MTQPLYDQPPTPNDGQFYPIYREFCDMGDDSESAAATSGEGGGQPATGSSEMSQTEGSFPHDWYHGLGDAELFFPPSPPGIVSGESGHGLHPQIPWGCGAQAYPALMGGTVAMTTPSSQYFPAVESMDSYFEPVKWPPTPMGQSSPTPSQNSHYDSSPARGCGPHFFRQNGRPSLPAPRAAAVEQFRFDARFRPMPDQIVSPRDDPFTPGGTVDNGRLHTVTESSPSADNQATHPPRGNRGNTQSQRVTTTTTTDYNAGTLSPVATPSPTNGTATAIGPYSPISYSARGTPEHERPKSGGRKHAPRPTHRPTAQQKQKQGQKPPPAQRARNREAANKCRAKTKLAVADLESTERAMSSENRELSATARVLRDEVLRLKHALLAHGNCDDDLIQQYLTNQARMVGGGGVQ